MTVGVKVVREGFYEEVSYEQMKSARGTCINSSSEILIASQGLEPLAWPLHCPISDRMRFLLGSG